MKKILSSSLRRELKDIYAGIHEDSPAAAERFMDEIESVTESLTRLPNMGRIWKSKHSQVGEVRVWPMTRFSNYLIFYRHTADCVEFLHVAHGARDLGDLFGEPSVD